MLAPGYHTCLPIQDGARVRIGISKNGQGKRRKKMVAPMQVSESCCRLKSAVIDVADFDYISLRKGLSCCRRR